MVISLGCFILFGWSSNKRLKKRPHDDEMKEGDDDTTDSHYYSLLLESDMNDEGRRRGK